MTNQTIATIFALLAFAGLIMFGSYASKTELKQPDESIVLSPVEVVQRFIEADMAGARIGGETAKQAPEIEQYVLWEFGPGWDTAMTINQFQIADSNESNGIALVRVIYFCENGGLNFETNNQGIISLSIKDCLNFFSEQDDRNNLLISYDYENKTEAVLHVLRQEQGEWKIVYPVLPPHISISTFQARFNEIQNEIK